MGGQSSQLRFRIATNLLEWGFARFTHYHATKEGEPAGAGSAAETLAIY
jgi:D-alanyl-D-alanine carboxypeptidase